MNESVVVAALIMFFPILIIAGGTFITFGLGPALIVFGILLFIFTIVVAVINS